MKKLRIIILMTIALIALALPDAAFAQNAQALDPGPEWNITIEFHYVKGDEGSLNIPDSIAQYGRTYHLVSKAAPVLAKKLPATREYTWLVDGTISEADKGLLDGLGEVELTPTQVAVERVADKHIKETGLPTNDVEDIAFARTIDGANYTRAAIRFEVEEYDVYNLPVSYEAEIVYRGLETYMGPGYIVKASYTTTEELDGVPVYVVAATYAPDGLFPAAGAGQAGGGAAGGGAAGGGESGVPDNPENAAAPVDENAPAEEAVTEPALPPIDVPATTIDDEIVPQAAGDGNASESANPVALILIVIAAAAGGFIAWMFLTRKRNMAKKRIEREAKKREDLLRSSGLLGYDG